MKQILNLKLKELLPYSNFILIAMSILIILLILVPMNRVASDTLGALIETQKRIHWVFYSGNSGRYDRLQTERIREILEELAPVNSSTKRWAFEVYRDALIFLLDKYDDSVNKTTRESLGYRIQAYLSLFLREYTEVLESRMESVRTLFTLLILAFITYFFTTIGSLVHLFKLRYRRNIDERSRMILQDIREKERNRLAAILHDRVLQDLGALVMDPDLNKLPALKPRILAVNDRVRMLIQGLRPEQLYQEGLKVTVEDFICCFTVDPSIYHCDFDDRDDSNVSELMADREAVLVIYEIIQELILNIEEHAQALKVRIKTTVRDHTLELRVEDDGVGFLSPPGGRNLHELGPTLGLIGHQIRYAGGIIEIDSVLGKGCSVYIAYPLKSTEVSPLP